MGKAEIVSIAASCPALQQLTLKNVTAGGFVKSCLLQLPAGVTSVEASTGLDLHLELLTKDAWVMSHGEWVVFNLACVRSLFSFRD
jgi:hypothetical protein